jgi:hypothetical protein
MTKKEGKELQCRECRRTFIFTDDEAKFFESKGLQEPKRCYQCRVVAKIARKECMNMLKEYGLVTYAIANTDTTSGEDEEA